MSEMASGSRTPFTNKRPPRPDYLFAVYTNKGVLLICPNCGANDHFYIAKRIGFLIRFTCTAPKCGHKFEVPISYFYQELGPATPVKTSGGQCPA